MSNIIFENSKFRLELDSACVARSLIYKPSGEECLADEERLPLFSVTQNRPYNNENKLIYMNKKTAYPANRVRQEGERLIIGFDIAPYEAVVEVKVSESYMAFNFVDFIVHPEDYDYLQMALPPVEEFRLVQLPLKKRDNYGKWLNTVWDKNVAVNVLSTSPHARIDSEERRDCRILTADAVKGIKLRGCGAALIVSATDELFDAVDAVERDFDLPRGVESRRSEWINSSICWMNRINPTNVDRYIEMMKKGGFRLALIYYKSIFDETDKGYSYCGDYERYREEYPRGDEDLKEMLDKIKAAGIVPGIHFLHTHIGLKTKYVTPHADRRLHLTRHFTLSKPIGRDDTTLYVDENPEGCVITAPNCRVLKFGGELISYESYTTEPPYRFEGCVRGFSETEPEEQRLGTIGGLLDISEYSASSVYLDQESDIQDEIADNIARIYGLGFEFVYFDGSEGTNAPFEFHVPNAQYRVYKKLPKAPLFCEGAAKSHFGWHMLSGANAFDVFPTDIFKAMIDKFPVKAAKVMREDFTRVNFGWWELFNDTQPDTYEYGMSRAVAWNCPATVMARLSALTDIPRLDDILEVMRRWEDAKEKGLISEEQKEIMRNTSDEHTMLINEKGDYEVVPYEEILGTPDGVRAFVFERCGERYVSIWHKNAECEITLPAAKDKISYFTDFGKEEIETVGNEKSVTFTVNSRKYIKTSLTKDEICEAIKNSSVK
jgi:hypothetical protein